MSTSPDSAPSLGEFRVRCHCGNVSARIQCDKKKITVWDCNCSDCSMRRNTHFVIPSTQFKIENEAAWHEATTLYQWGTKTAVRRFCKTCGILPWYIARSNPDGVAITVSCVDFGDSPPQIEVKKFDGVNWEQSIKTSDIVDESKSPSAS